ncbi:gamma-glutamyltransferase [Lichenicoccus sp.]|uniref:gamma-glutamyltransferase n=1 Tax=Lichenicoccus sp. TaxID=2781899 RepID=UPI003D1134DD
MRISTRHLNSLAACIGLALLAGCSGVQKVKALVTGPSSPYLTGYIGEVAADEPRAALVGRDILARGGNAADAAAALGLALSVTLPSRASLGAGGACLAYDASGAAPDAILFTSVAGAPGLDADRPAAVPMLARGLFLLQARHGHVGFDELTRPAAGLARDGITVSRAFADDLAQVSQPLLADPGTRAIFGAVGGGTGGGVPVAGDQLVQPTLSETLSRIALSGVGELYTGALSRDFVAGADAAGGGLDADSMRSALPTSRAALHLQSGRYEVGFLPPPADGGLAAAAGFAALEQGQGDAVGVSQAAAAAWRARHPQQGNGDHLAEAAQLVLDEALHAGASGAPLSRLPASTSFVVLDRSGNAVSCAVSMNNLFGTGRVAGDTGILLAASPARVPAPLLPAAIAYNPSGNSFRAAVAGSGQNQAAGAVAAAMHNALAGVPLSHPVTETGRVNTISCPQGLPGDSNSCAGTTDPRGAGLAIGSE